jgi:pimeloyl-ACP methyl ester carboxylesterase
MIESVGDGPPLVFVHGNASTRATWAETIAPLARRYRCISYDLAGHGGPELRGEGPTLEGLVADLEEIIAELRLTRFGLVGHSLGAFIAAAYAEKHPDKVAALALLAMPAGKTTADREAGARLIEALKSGGVAAVMGRLVGFWYRDDFVERHPEALAERLDQIAAIPDDVFIRTYALYNAVEIAPVLPLLSMPTLVMTGELARGAPASVARFAAGELPKGRALVFEGLKNGILTEVPNEVAAVLGEFFAGELGLAAR